MSHHEVLDTVSRGTSVILCEHSNSERGFLTLFKERLSSFLPDSVKVIVSQRDRDPLQVVWTLFLQHMLIKIWPCGELKKNSVDFFVCKVCGQHRTSMKKMVVLNNNNDKFNFF